MVTSAVIRFALEGFFFFWHLTSNCSFFISASAQRLHWWYVREAVSILSHSFRCSKNVFVCWFMRARPEVYCLVLNIENSPTECDRYPLTAIFNYAVCSVGNKSTYPFILTGNNRIRPLMHDSQSVTKRRAVCPSLLFSNLNTRRTQNQIKMSLLFAYSAVTPVEMLNWNRWATYSCKTSKQTMNGGDKFG